METKPQNWTQGFKSFCRVFKSEVNFTGMSSINLLLCLVSVIILLAFVSFHLSLLDYDGIFRQIYL